MVHSQIITESLTIYPTYLTLTLWSMGLNPCAVFPFLLCCKLSQSYSTSGFPISLQNVHIQSPLKGKQAISSCKFNKTHSREKPALQNCLGFIFFPFWFLRGREALFLSDLMKESCMIKGSQNFPQSLITF